MLQGDEVSHAVSVQKPVPPQASMPRADHPRRRKPTSNQHHLVVWAAGGRRGRAGVQHFSPFFFFPFSPRCLPEFHLRALSTSAGTESVYICHLHKTPTCGHPDLGTHKQHPDEGDPSSHPSPEFASPLKYQHEPLVISV